jgi:Rrf2 family protein
MLELALHYEKQPLSISQIAELEEISPKFLGQIIIPLKGAGLIRSTRGARGGYELTRPPKNITVFEVFRVLEGGGLVTECREDPGGCTRAAGCVARNIWGDLSQAVEKNLASLDFHALAGQARALAEKQSPVYQI